MYKKIEFLPRSGTNMSKNRVSKFFEKTEENRMILFEKFDPKIIQQMIQESFADDESDEPHFDEEKTMQAQRLILSQDSQLVRTSNLWIGHLKTYITPELAEKLSMIPGVESLDVFTPYRFRFGVAKLFQEREVKKNITELVSNHMKKGPMLGQSGVV